MANTKVLTQILEDLASPQQLEHRDIISVQPECEPSRSEALRLASTRYPRSVEPSDVGRHRTARSLQVPGDRPLGQRSSAGTRLAGLPPVHGVDRGGPLSSSPDFDLKLVVEPGQMAALLDSPPVVTYARNKGAARLIKDTYYDTPAGALRRAGVTLRIRQCGNRFVQTVKAAPAETGMLLRRDQWEFPVAGMAPDFQAVVPLMEMGLQDALTRDPLRPAFSAELRRRLRALALPTGTVDVAFDIGVVKSGERTLPICEIKIALKRGAPAAVYDLALLLSEHAAVRPATRSEASVRYLTARL